MHELSLNVIFFFCCKFFSHFSKFLMTGSSNAVGMLHLDEGMYRLSRIEGQFIGNPHVYSRLGRMGEVDPYNVIEIIFRPATANERSLILGEVIPETPPRTPATSPRTPSTERRVRFVSPTEEVIPRTPSFSGIRTPPVPIPTPPARRRIFRECDNCRLVDILIGTRCRCTNGNHQLCHECYFARTGTCVTCNESRFGVN
jgi:hypothetical protein